MRRCLLSSIFMLSVGLHADEYTLVVMPQSLAGWRIVGAPADTLSSAAILSLPAGAQMVRPFTATTLSVNITSRPSFGRHPADWPVLELGSGALVFLREGDEGRLALSLDDSPSVEIPVSVRLDDTGRSAEPLPVTLSRNETTFTVTVAGQSWPYPVAAPDHPTLEVVASAGQGEAWSFEHLSITVLRLAPPVATDRSPHGGSATTDSTRTATVKVPRTGDDRPAHFPPPPAVVSGQSQAALLTPPLSAGQSTLEVFTPSSVRQGRADSIRAAVAQILPQKPEAAP